MNPRLPAARVIENAGVLCVVLEVTISADIIKTPSCATKHFYGCGLRMRAESALIDNDRIFPSSADYGHSCAGSLQASFGRNDLMR